MVIFNVDGCYLVIEDVCSYEVEILFDGLVYGFEIICLCYVVCFLLFIGEVLMLLVYELIVIFFVWVEQGRVQVRDNCFD